MKPYLGISKNLLGIIWPYATTTAMSGFNELKNLNSSSLSKVLGVLKLKENFFAKLPTFESNNF